MANGRECECAGEKLAGSCKEVDVWSLMQKTI